MTRKITANGPGSSEPFRPEPGPLFPNSQTRHGTHSGWSKHQVEGTDPCAPCVMAKAHYDWRWRRGDDTQRKNRLRARAQQLAFSEMRRRFPSLYSDLYQEIVAELFEQAGYDPPKPRSRR